MTIFLLHLSVYLQWVGSFLITFTAFYRFRKKPPEILILGCYGVASFVFQSLQNINNHYGLNKFIAAIGNVYVLFETVTLLSLYCFVIKARKIKGLIIVFFVAYTVFYFLVMSNQMMTMSSSVRAFRDLLMITCSVLYFFHLLKELPEESLVRIPMFWINSAILFFFSCTFILSLFLGYIIEAMQGDLNAYWTFRNFLRVLFCVIICIGIWQARKKSIASSKKNSWSNL
jgi:hypothetical protein